ncbi:MAG: hypothetical protein EGQ91_05750 [Clostridiales bacterium]|nr:hypothetical protein [Clostridiales bacterium]
MCGVLFFGANALPLLCDFAQKDKVVTIICRKIGKLIIRHALSAKHKNCFGLGMPGRTAPLNSNPKIPPE